MLRKGWTALETPNGWFQMIRGPRPPWCVGRRLPDKSNVGVGGDSPKIRFSTATTRGAPRQNGDAFPSAPGPRLKTSGLRPFQDPDSRVVTAKDRVSRLERALEAMGDSEGPEVDGLRAALEKAKEFAEGVLLEKQIKDGEQFLIRAKGHLVEFEKERNTVEASIADAERRLEKLRAQADLLPPQAPLQPPASAPPMSGTSGRVGGDQCDTGASSRAPTNFWGCRRWVCPNDARFDPGRALSVDRRSESDLQEALVSGDTTRVLNVEDGGRGRTIEGDHMQSHGPLKLIVRPINCPPVRVVGLPGGGVQPWASTDLQCEVEDNPVGQ